MRREEFSLPLFEFLYSLWHFTPFYILLFLTKNFNYCRISISYSYVGFGIFFVNCLWIFAYNFRCFYQNLNVINYINTHLLKIEQSLFAW